MAEAEASKSEASKSEASTSESYKYFNTTLKIYIVTHGDLILGQSERFKFEYNMLNKKASSSPSYFYLLKNTTFEENLTRIKNIINDDTITHEIFSKKDTFEKIANDEFIKEKNVTISNEKRIENIDKNINFILKTLFPYKTEITVRNKEYIIAKNTLLYKDGTVHSKGDTFIQLNRYKDDKPTFKEKIMKVNTSELRTENNINNSINIVIDLNLLNKSNNPTTYDFVNVSCQDKRDNMKDIYDKLLFSLVGVNLKMSKEDEKKRREDIVRFNLNVNTKERREKERKEKERKEKYDSYLYGYHTPMYDYRRGGRTQKIRKIKNKNNKKKTNNKNKNNKNNKTRKRST